MKQIDTRMSTEEKVILASMVGKTFSKYRCDEFHFRPAVYQAVGVYIDNQAFSIENETQVLDYYGAQEDVGVISIKSVRPDEVVSHIVNGTQVDTPIGQVIQDIRIVEDTHIMSKGNEDLYEFGYTKAIVFVLSDRQVVFEKDVWFSEDIFIYRGSDAESKITPVEDDLESSEEFNFRAKRNVTSLANPLPEM